SKVSIEVDEKATEPRLIVPIQAMFGGVGFGGGVGVGGGFGVGGGVQGQFQGQTGARGVQGGQAGNFGNRGVQGGGAGALGQPPGGTVPPGAPQAPPEKQSSLHFSTIMVGLALTLSLSFGGLWLVRKKAGVPGSS